ncbi:P-loop NTPase fold protein [Clostridium perfringens]
MFIIILVCKIKKYITIKEYIYNFFILLLNFIWVPVTCIILAKIINIQRKSEVNTILENINNNIWIIIGTLLLGVFLELHIKYKNSRKKYIKHNINNFMIGVVVLYINKYILTLDIFNIWLGIFIILVNIKVLFNLEIFDQKNKKITTNKMKEYVCESYDELFPTRKNQADILIDYIDSFNKNDIRFTLLINGKWGTGKTSLIKAIENKVKDRYIMIFIQPMIFDKRELLIKYFCERLREVLEKEMIYTGKGSNLESYLVSLLNLVNKKVNIGLKDISIDKKSKDFREIKKNLQKDIKVCTKNKRIIVIVDDFDRVGIKIKKEVLMFIRELIDFDGIDTVLLMEYSKLLDEKNGLTKEYLDKYIDKRIELSSVEFNEIIKYFIDIEIKNIEFDFYNKIIDYNQFSILIGGLYNLKINISLIKKHFENSIEVLDKKYYNSENVKNEELIKKYKNKREEISDKINNFYNNIRLIKKVVRETVDCYKKLQLNYIDKIILDNNDLTFIIKIIIIKNLFLEEFDVMIKMNDFQEYIENIYFYAKNNVTYTGVIDNEYIKEFLIEIFKGKIDEVKKVNRYKIANAIIKSDFKNINFENKSNAEKIIYHIDNIEGENIIEYIFTLNKVSKIENITSDIRYIYGLIFSKFYNGDSYELTKKRVKKLNENLVNFLKDTNNILEVLLQIYCDMTKVYKQWFLINWIIKDIYKLSKEDTFIDYNKRNKIRQAIENSKIDILVHITNIAEVLLRCLNLKTIEGEFFYSVAQLNKVIEERFSGILEIEKLRKLDENEKLRCNLINIIDYLFEKNYLKYTEFKKLKQSVLFLLIVENIMSKISEKIEKNKKIKNSYEVRRCIEQCKNYIEFKRISIGYIDNILSKDDFNSDDLNIIWGIKYKIQEFIDKENQDEIIEKINTILQKVENIKYPNDYNYLDIIKLRIDIDNIKLKKTNHC